MHECNMFCFNFSEFYLKISLFSVGFNSPIFLQRCGFFLQTLEMFSSIIPHENLRKNCNKLHTNYYEVYKKSLSHNTCAFCRFNLCNYVTLMILSNSSQGYSQLQDFQITNPEKCPKPHTELSKYPIPSALNVFPMQKFPKQIFQSRGHHTLEKFSSVAFSLCYQSLEFNVFFQLKNSPGCEFKKAEKIKTLHII